MVSKSGFAGIYPMVYAIFDSAGRLSADATRLQVKAMLRHKVHGIGVLGLASETNKLTLAERHELMERVAEAAGGSVPLAVTISEPNVAAATAFARAAATAGAHWVILQPPPVRGLPEAELVRFFGAVADVCPLPVGIQNAPEYLGIGLSSEGLIALVRAHPNVVIAKVEASGLAIDRLNAILEGSVDIFNGRGGIDMIDALRAGAVGIIPGAECFDVLRSIFDDLSAPGGDADRAAQRYAAILPLLVFLMESMDTFIVYGKEVLRCRLGLGEIHQRLPASPATPFGLYSARRYAAALGPL
ncbi:MAG: dihydrodipicolinate synthase family protein [Rhodospirillales bacterium]|nr:dihydrodipicolinate synthase family protein [Rhodospirillales bacterium]